uniref:1,4-dihydroxy-2-naphthoate octaprenyltransferase n=1 Tax=Candidatus Cryptobacteroides bacterium TaxID=3085639 RepID=UPI004026E68C
MTLKASIKSMRLRTLPLSLSGVILGVTLAADKTDVSPWTAALIFLTTVCLQILSNLSNELGDTLSGTDSADRQGPKYALGSGDMTIGDIKKLILMFIGLCVISGLAMIQVSFGSLFKTESICLEALGAAAIVGAMKYTLGKNPYGYRGLGDVFVFIFFGLVSVLGGYYVAARELPPLIMLLPASAIGYFSVGVLNVNNIRDMKTDAVNRVTVAIKLGMKGARIYQTILVTLGWALILVFCAVYDFAPGHYIFIITLPLYIKHLQGVWTRSERALDPMLPMLVISTFFLSILAGAGFLIF